MWLIACEESNAPRSIVQHVLNGDVQKRTIVFASELSLTAALNEIHAFKELYNKNFPTRLLSYAATNITQIPDDTDPEALGGVDIIILSKVFATFKKDLGL